MKQQQQQQQHHQQQQLQLQLCFLLTFTSTDLGICCTLLLVNFCMLRQSDMAHAGSVYSYYWQPNNNMNQQ
jgi:hypothetical protein